MTLPQRIALVLLTVFLGAAVAAFAIPSSSYGADCGTWVTPEWDRAETRALVDRMESAYDDARDLEADELAGDASSLAGQAIRAQLGCDDKLGTRRTLTIASLVLAVVGPAAVIFIAGARRQAKS